MQHGSTCGMIDPATLASLSEEEQLHLAMSLSSGSSGGMQRALDGLDPHDDNVMLTMYILQPILPASTLVLRT